jgi:hypothetical protein
VPKTVEELQAALRAGPTAKKLVETIQGQDVKIPDAANAEPKVTTLKTDAAIEAEKQRAEAIAAKAKEDEKAKCGPSEETESVPMAAATDKKAPVTTVAAADTKKDEKKDPPKIIASADDKPKPKVAAATMSA